MWRCVPRVCVQSFRATNLQLLATSSLNRSTYAFYDRVFFVCPPCARTAHAALCISQSASADSDCDSATRKRIKQRLPHIYVRFTSVSSDTSTILQYNICTKTPIKKHSALSYNKAVRTVWRKAVEVAPGGAAHERRDADGRAEPRAPRV